MSDFEDRLRLLHPRPLSQGLWGRVSAGHIPFRTRKFMIGGAMLVVASGMLAFLAYVLLSPLPKGSTATPAQAEETAEGIFKKIEESIAKAKTVRVRCRTSSKMQFDPFKGECTLVFRQDGKAFAKMADLVILSDGATTRITGGSAVVIEKAAPKSLHDDLS